MGERREAPRILPPSPLQAKIKTILPARVVDVSATGIQVELAAALPVKARCDIRIQGEDDHIAFTAIVRRCVVLGRGEQEGKRVLLYRAGLRFEDMKPADIKNLAARFPGLAASEIERGDGPSVTVGLSPGDAFSPKES